MNRTSTTQITSQTFIELGRIIAENSNGDIRLAFNEKDNNRETDTEAAHFLKLNEKRWSRDLELYGLMFNISPEQALPDFLGLLIQIKMIYPKSYEKASVELKKLGSSVYTEQVLVAWNELFI